MSRMFEYGIVSSEKDEKMVIKHIMDFLQPMKRSLSKSQSKSMLEARLPYVYKHFYFNLNKEMQVYFEIYPNKDLENKYKFKDNQDIAWIMFIRQMNSSNSESMQERYISDLLNSIKHQCIFLKEYTDRE